MNERVDFKVEKGLAGVYVDTTAIADVDGERGRLSYRGYDVADLVGLDYDAVVWLVLFGELPDHDQRRWLGGLLRERGTLSAYEIALIEQLPADTHPMAALQALVPVSDTPLAALADPYALGADALTGLLLIAKLPVLLAALHQRHSGRPIALAQRYEAYHDNFIANFLGEAPTPQQRAILDVTQILQMEHSFNAGTFTCRVVASTLASLKSSVAAGYGALSGPLHGGADEAALAMAQAIGAPERAEAFVADQLAAKQKIMGMGHREYRTVDPRAKILKPLAAQLCAGTPHENLFRILESVESAFRAAMLRSGKDLWANVDFYKGAVYTALGIEPRYFTALFAMARTVGYVAHFLETRLDNKLVRPRALYNGPAPRTPAQEAAS